MNILERKFPAFTNEFLKERLCTNLKFCPMEFWFFDDTGMEQRVLGSRCWEWLEVNAEKMDFFVDKKVYNDVTNEYIIVWNLNDHQWDRIPLNTLINFYLTDYKGTLYFK